MKTAYALPLLVLLALGGGSLARGADELVVEDIFGRRLNEYGMVLVDWEGQIANPALKVFVRPPPDAAFPGNAVLTANHPRLYFDLPSEATAGGPSKTIVFPDRAAVPVFVSIFPDRDGANEEHALAITFTAGNGVRTTLALKVQVIDQDQPQRGNDFQITVDFSRDRTGFFADATKRDVVRQMADDWAYFFAGMNLATVPVGAEQTFIWDSDGFLRGNFIRNENAYRGFLLYAYGVSAAVPPFRSGGEASAAGGLQVSNGQVVPLKRSGGVEIETKGNFNTLGWTTSGADNDWWQATNLAHVSNDLASIAHHEIGHALIFHPNQTRFGIFKAAGIVNDTSVVRYHGRAPAVTAPDHLGENVDRLSGKGAFGHEYFGTVPARRWLITKLDLLVAQAIGYSLRDTSPFTPLAIATRQLPDVLEGEAYAQTLTPRGGVPFYRWSIKSGALPPGLTLDSFTGAITGRSAIAGTHAFTVELADYDAATPPVTVALSIRVNRLSDLRGRLSNLSILTELTAAEPMFTVGTVVDGGATGATLPLLVRAVGPSLAAFGVTNVLADPRLELLAGTTVVAANDNWGGGSALATSFGAVGAFAFLAPQSSDAAVLFPMATAESYSLRISGAPGSTGAVLAELYDATPPGTLPGVGVRFINVSVLKQVGGGETLTAGFAISGRFEREVLLRAVGPTLAAPPFNLSSAMSDPRLDLYVGQTVMASNGDWGGAPNLAAAFAKVGAFPLLTGSKDAALLVTLPPGTYSARMTAADGGGLVLIEIYEVP